MYCVDYVGWYVLLQSRYVPEERKTAAELLKPQPFTWLKSEWNVKARMKRVTEVNSVAVACRATFEVSSLSTYDCFQTFYTFLLSFSWSFESDEWGIVLGKLSCITSTEPTAPFDNISLTLTRWDAFTVEDTRIEVILGKLNPISTPSRCYLWSLDFHGTGFRGSAKVPTIQVADYCNNGFPTELENLSLCIPISLFLPETFHTGQTFYFLAGTVSHLVWLDWPW